MKNYYEFMLENVDETDWTDELLKAVDNDNMTSIELAIRNGANVNLGLARAIKNNNRDLIVYFQEEHGADPDNNYVLQNEDELDPDNYD
jgi:hypothetical protein